MNILLFCRLCALSLLLLPSLAMAESSRLIFQTDPAGKEAGKPAAPGEEGSGFKVAPSIAEKGGRRTLSGPADLRIKPVDGVITIRFGLLGLESATQQDLVSIDSAAGVPFAVIRNVNSSGRISGKTVVSGAGNKFTPGGWHDVEAVIDTRKGRVRVSCDGKLRYDEQSEAAGSQVSGVRLGKMAALDGLSIAAAPLPPVSAGETRLKDLRKTLGREVEALSEATAGASRKKAVLRYHLEQIDKAIAQEAIEAGLGIAADLQAGLGKDIGRKQEEQEWLRPVAQLKNNPYLAPALNAEWYAGFSAKPDYPWKLPTPEAAAYNGLHRDYGVREQAIKANEWMLLYSHPQSPLKDKTELLIRAMRRIDAYMEDYRNGRREHDDFFALGPALMGAVMIDRTFPEMLLPTQRKHWIEAAQKAAETYSRMGYHGDYSNADLGTARIFLASALLTGNKEHLDRGMRLAYSWGDNIYEDGASSYIGKQNESPGYHAACIDIEFDNYLLTGDPKLLEILRRVENYPVSCTDSNFTTEWFTPPSWKQSWYGADGFRGSPIIYYLTGNRYLQTLGSQEKFESPAEPSIKLAGIYKTHPWAPLPLPNNYTVYDRNIQGVRMNYGLYSAAMNGRVTASLAGKNTYVGLTLAEAHRGGKPAFSAAVYGVNAFPVNGGSGANTISQESISVAHGRGFAALGAGYTLARRMAGPARQEVPWKGKQVWLYLPDRMIGLVELAPDGRQKANAVTLNIELGRGKAGAIDASPARLLNDRDCQFGNLLVRVHETNLKGVRLSPVADGLANDGVRGSHNEWHLVDEPNMNGWSPAARDYEGTSFAVVELRVAGAPDPARVERIESQGLVGLSVEVAGRKYTALYNPGTAAAGVETARFTDRGKSSLFADRNTFARPVSVPAVASVPPKEIVIIVSGDDGPLHLPGFVGWSPFLAYFEQHKAEFDIPPGSVPAR